MLIDFCLNDRHHYGIDVLQAALGSTVFAALKKSKLIRENKKKMWQTWIISWLEIMNLSPWINCVIRLPHLVCV